MNGDISGLWLLAAVLTGAVGSAMFIYGVRQKDPLPLVFGIVIGGVPMFFDSAASAAVVSILCGVLFYMLRAWSK